MLSSPFFFNRSCHLQASLSFPGSPFDGRRRSSQLPVSSLTWARNGKKYGDRKPLVLASDDYTCTSFHVQDQDQIPFADADSGEMMSENYYHNNHNHNNHQQQHNNYNTNNYHRNHNQDESTVMSRCLECDHGDDCDENDDDDQLGLDGSDPLLVRPSVVHSSQLHSRHSSYTSHSSRLSYTSHHGGESGGGILHKGLPHYWTSSSKTNKRSDSLRSSKKSTRIHISSPPSSSGPLLYNEVTNPYLFTLPFTVIIIPITACVLTSLSHSPPPHRFLLT